MSVVWIKVNREKKTHSAYSDGIQVSPNDEIVSDDTKKITNYEFLNTSILLGAVGSSHGTAYIKKYFPIRWKTSNIQYWNEDTTTDLAEFFEDMANEYQNKYSEPLKNTVILSINGNLFWINSVRDGKIWQVSRINKNFICAGAPENEAKTLLYYNENIDPQDLLNTLAKVQTTTNTNLYKIENISYDYI